MFKHSVGNLQLDPHISELFLKTKEDSYFWQENIGLRGLVFLGGRGEKGRVQ